MQNSSQFSDAKTRWITFIVLLLYILVGMGIDLIAPSLPAISKDLNISDALSKNLISIYLLGVACSTLILGLLSDAIGRRKIVLLSFLFFTIGSLIPIFYANSFTLLFARFLQGCAIGGYSSNGRSILSDVLPHEKLLKIMVLVGMMWGIGPILGPIIGGYLQYYFGWKANFYFFTVFGILGFTLIFLIVPETHFFRQPLSLKKLKQNFITVFTHRMFLGTVFVMGCAYSLIITFNVWGPFIIQEKLHYSSIAFGHIAFFLGLVYVIGTFICRYLVGIVPVRKLLLFSISIFLLLAIVNLVLAFIISMKLSLIILASIEMFIACGIIYPTGMGVIATLFKHLAGSGSGIMSFVTIMITALIGFILSLIPAHTTIGLNSAYCFLLLIAMISYLFFIYPNKE